MLPLPPSHYACLLLRVFYLLIFSSSFSPSFIRPFFYFSCYSGRRVRITGGGGTPESPPSLQFLDAKGYASNPLASKNRNPLGFEIVHETLRIRRSQNRVGNPYIRSTRFTKTGTTLKKWLNPFLVPLSILLCI